MADRGDTHYHVPNLNLWFLLSSLAFLITMIWTVIDDWNAEWKQYQVEFRRLDLESTQSQVTALNEGGMAAVREELESAVEAARERLGGKVDELQTAKAQAYAEKEKRCSGVSSEYRMYRPPLIPAFFPPTNAIGKSSWK